LLPANGSELVLFDANRSPKFQPFLTENSRALLARIFGTGPHAFRFTVPANDHTPWEGMTEYSLLAGGFQFAPSQGSAFPGKIRGKSFALRLHRSRGFHTFSPPNDLKSLTLKEAK
jgi:hypothetical protein